MTQFHVTNDPLPRQWWVLYFYRFHFQLSSSLYSGYSCISRSRRAALRSISFGLLHPCFSHLARYCHVSTHSWHIFLNSLSTRKVENIMWMSCPFVDITIVKRFLKQCSIFEHRTTILAFGIMPPANDDSRATSKLSRIEWRFSRLERWLPQTTILVQLVTWVFLFASAVRRYEISLEKNLKNLNNSKNSTKITKDRNEHGILIHRNLGPNSTYFESYKKR